MPYSVVTGLRGEEKKRSYRIGDTVRVRVDKVDAVRKRIDFTLSVDVAKK